MYKPVQKKSSSWTPASSQSKSKSLTKPGTFSVQPKSESKSSQQQEIPSYSTAAADALAANVMRSLEMPQQEQEQATSVQRQIDPGAAFVANGVTPIAPSPTPSIQSKEVGIQRQCAECAKEQQEESAQEGKDLDEMSEGAGAIQTKLTVGASGDKYEQEADQVAAQVMSMSVTPDSSPQVQRFGEEDNPVQRWSLAQSITPVVQRQVDEQVQMRELVQRAFQAGGNEASGDLEGRLNASKGGGSALSEDVRSFMEPRFGADFSGVRVHTGGEAVQMNRELGAQAFTHGSDLYFGEGKSPGNNELTAHELTHVVQQTGGVQRLVRNESSVSDQSNAQIRVQRANTYNDCSNAQRTAIQDAYNRAIGKVNASVTALAAAYASHPTIDAHTRALLNRHFHTTNKNDISTIQNRFRDIKRAFDAGINFECETGCESGVQGYVYKFLFWHVGRVHVCFDRFNREAQLEQEAIIIHEVAHRFAGVGDNAYIYQPGYASLSPKKAIDNADSYAYFATEL